MSSGDNEDTRPDLDLVLARYVDRINTGQRVQAEEVHADHPDSAAEILDQLEAFQEIDFEFHATEPLGTLGDYTLRRQIGRGGMGVVYEAWQNSVERQVALKVLPAGVAADNKAFVRFMREARTAAQLSHRNVVGVHGMGQEEHTPYYAMEYVEGETLAQILARLKEATDDTETPFGKKDDTRYFANIAETFADVADGLQHAHSKRVVHRDIKPSNLILDGEGKLRILDFGLARLEGQESLTLSGDLMGTVLYMSPEQAMAKRIPIDHRTDVYSLGVTMYEVLTGQPPFRGKDQHDTLSQIIVRDPRPPRQLKPRVPVVLETILLKCLRKDPADRYGTAEALVQDLRRFVRGDPIEARPQSRVELWTRRMRVHRLRLTLGAVVAALLVLVVWVGLRELEATRKEKADSYETSVHRAAMVAHLGMLAGGENLGPINAVPYFEPEDLAGISSAEAHPLEAMEEELEHAEGKLPARFEAPYHRARLLALLGREDEARDALRRSLTCRPDFVPAQLLLREIEGRDTAEVLPARESWSRHWVSAYRAFRERRWKDAARSYAELIRIEERQGELYLGSSIEGRLSRGVASLEAGDPVSAIIDFAAAADRWPGFREPTLLLAVACHRMDRRDLARAVLENLYDRAPSRDEAAYWIVSTLRAVGNYEEALRWADSIEREALRAQVKAALLIFFSRFTEAAEAAREAIHAAPADPLSRALLAVSLGFQTRTRGGESRRRLIDEALSAARKACDLKPARGVFQAALAFVLQEGGQSEAANAAIARALELEANDIVTLYIAGDNALGQGRMADAERIFRRAAEEARVRGRPHEEAICRAKISDSLRSQGRAKQAFEEQWRAVSSFPFYLGYSELAHLYLRRLGDSEAAERMHVEASRLNPRDNNDFFGRRAEALNGHGKYAEALEIVEGILNRSPDASEALFIRGKTQVELDQPGAALESYVSSLTNWPGWRWPARDLARLLLFFDLPGGDPRLDPLADTMERSFARGLGSRDWFRDAGCALLLLRARTGRDPERARELAERALEAEENHFTLATFAWTERERGDQAAGIRWLERAVASPEAPLQLAELLEVWRRELSGRWVSYATVDARGSRWQLSVDETVAVDAAEVHASRYARARRLEDAGEIEAAAEVFRDLARSDREGAEPRLGLARCLSAEGKPEAAEALLREWLLEHEDGDRRGWEHWAALVFSELRWSPEEALARVESRSGTGTGEMAPDDSFLADLRWLRDALGSSASGGWLGILAGSTMERQIDGRAWSRDRLFRGGASIGWEEDLESEGTDAIYERMRRFAPGRRKATLGRSYRIPLPRGLYRVTLWLSAIDCSSAGPRHVQIEAQRPGRCDDVELEHRRRACRKSVDIAVVDGILDIDIDPGIRGLNVAAIEVERLE